MHVSIQWINYFIYYYLFIYFIFRTYRIYNPSKFARKRDYTQINDDTKPERIYGPELGDAFGKLNEPRFIAIIPKQWFATINNNNNNNNNHQQQGSSSSSSSKQQPFSSDDDILVVGNTNSHQIVLIEKTGGKVKSILGKRGNQPGELNRPMGIAVTKRSTTITHASSIILFVANYKNNRIQSFDVLTGRYLDQFTHEKYMNKPGESRTTNATFLF